MSSMNFSHYGIILLKLLEQKKIHGLRSENLPKLCSENQDQRQWLKIRNKHTLLVTQSLEMKWNPFSCRPRSMERVYLLEKMVPRKKLEMHRRRTQLIGKLRTLSFLILSFMLPFPPDLFFKHLTEKMCCWRITSKGQSYFRQCSLESYL